MNKNKIILAAIVAALSLTGALSASQGTKQAPAAASCCDAGACCPGACCAVDVK